MASDPKSQNSYSITIERLVIEEMQGKALAIAGYDSILWKIRSGYAVVLYSSLAILSGLVTNKIISNSHSILLIMSIPILGFSIFGAILDYAFVKCKLRVVEDRDKLTEEAFRITANSSWHIPNNNLIDLLKNSGERKGNIDWENKTGIIEIFCLYVGTTIVAAVIIVLLINQ